jgi:hypothetical protein
MSHVLGGDRGRRELLHQVRIGRKLRSSSRLSLAMSQRSPTRSFAAPNLTSLKLSIEDATVTIEHMLTSLEQRHL